MTRKTTEILDKIEAVLSPEGAWTQGVYARDAAGLPINMHEDRATCFCLHGAKRRALGPHMPTGDLLTVDVTARLSAAAVTLFPGRAVGAKDRPGHRVAAFNDHHETTQADVIQVIRLAAAL